MKSLNRIEEGKERDFQPKDIFLKLNSEWSYLIDIKTRLSAANVGISDSLVKLTEAKANLAFWNGFTSAGQSRQEETKSVRRGGEYVDEKVVFISYFCSREITEFQEEGQKYIEKLQDEIDAYNATTKI